MSITRLKIDMANGTFEVEGDEGFVKQVYIDYKEKIFSQTKNITNREEKDDSNNTSEIKEGKKENKHKTSTKRSESHSIVNSLNLTPKDKETLKDFFKKKKPGNGYEKGTVFIYYLKRILDIDKVGVDHVYTCYKDVNERVPGALKQNLIDAADDKGWIDTKSTDDIGITTIGENFVEHDLPKTESSKK